MSKDDRTIDLSDPMRKANFDYLCRQGYIATTKDEIDNDPPKPENSALFEDIVRNIKFTETQCWMNEGLQKEQWKLERTARKEADRWNRLSLLTVVAQLTLMVVSIAALNLRVDHIERFQRQAPPASREVPLPKPQTAVEPTFEHAGPLAVRHGMSLLRGIDQQATPCREELFPFRETPLYVQQ